MTIAVCARRPQPLDPDTCLATVVAIAAVEAGATIREAARRCGRSYPAVHRLLSSYGGAVARRRKPRIAEGTKRRIARLVADEILGVREIAREVGVSPDSACRVAREAKRRMAARKSPPTHRRQVAPYRCKCGHQVAVSPCVICDSQAAATKSAA
jgi:hypothetical protein